MLSPVSPESVSAINGNPAEKGVGERNVRETSVGGNSMGGRRNDENVIMVAVERTATRSNA